MKIGIRFIECIPIGLALLLLLEEVPIGVFSVVVMSRFPFLVSTVRFFTFSFSSVVFLAFRVLGTSASPPGS